MEVVLFWSPLGTHRILQRWYPRSFVEPSSNPGSWGTAFTQYRSQLLAQHLCHQLTEVT